MIIRHDVTADTYRPLPFSTADLQHLGKADDGFAILKNAFRDHAPHLALDLGTTDTGVPFVSVTVPGVTPEDAAACITRNERGWQMHRGGDGPLYEFETAQEVAEFFRAGGRT